MEPPASSSPQQESEESEVVEMNHATDLAEKIQEVPFSLPQPQEQQPARELIDARERFAQKKKHDACRKAKNRLADFYDRQAFMVEAHRQRMLASLGGLWIE